MSGSRTQQMQALERANSVRTRRSRLKRRMAEGTTPLADVLMRPPEEMATAAVLDVLRSARGIGYTKARSALREVRVGELAPIGRLTERQRTEILGVLARRNSRVFERYVVGRAA